MPCHTVVKFRKAWKLTAPPKEAFAFFKAGEYVILSTLGENSSPLWCFHKGNVICHYAADGHRLKNIAFQGKVSFCVVTQAELVPDKFSTRFNPDIS